MKDSITTNKMGIENIPSLMLKMGIPIILSMMLQAAYNIVDSYFVSGMDKYVGIKGAGELGNTALTLAFPIQMLIVAISIGTGVGINALLSKSLGAKDTKKVSKIAGNAVSLGLIIYFVFFILGILFINIYVKTQTGNEAVLSMTGSYLRICTFLSFGIIMFGIYEKLLQSTGKTVLSTIAQISGAVANIILDPILIYGLCGLPAMGIRGAAYATVIGQILSMAIAMAFQYSVNKREIPFHFSNMKPSLSIIKEIYAIGFPAIVMQALMSFMTYGVNIIFGRVSEGAVTAYGLFYKIQQFIFFAGFGLRDAITPIVSFNHGMGNKKRVKDGIKYGIIYTEIIMFLGIIVLEIIAEPFIRVFDFSKGTATLAIYAMRIISLGFLFAGINISGQAIFQALECGSGSLIVSLLRLLIVPLPLAYIFTLTNNAKSLIWWAFPIGEFVAFIAAIIIMKKIFRKNGLTKTATEEVFL